MNATSAERPLIVVSELPPQELPLTLRCQACKSVGSYPVGRLSVDPAFFEDVRGRSNRDKIMSFTKVSWEKWVYFSGYFMCDSCGSGGPWQFSPKGKEEMAMLMVKHAIEPKTSGIFLGKPTLFDGMAPRTGFAAVEHLKKLIEAEPKSSFLWSRLGNTFVGAGQMDLAMPVFEKAVEFDPLDMESHHSMGDYWLEKGDDERAAYYFRQLLANCRHGTWRRKDLIEVLVREALESLVRIWRRSQGKFGGLPQPVASKETPPDESADLDPSEIDLTDPRAWYLLARFYLDGSPLKPSEAHARWESEDTGPTQWRPASVQKRAGRNDSCPCGSGRKFKHCCLRK